MDQRRRGRSWRRKIDGGKRCNMKNQEMKVENNKQTKWEEQKELEHIDQELSHHNRRPKDREHRDGEPKDEEHRCGRWKMEKIMENIRTENTNMANQEMEDKQQRTWRWRTEQERTERWETDNKEHKNGARKHGERQDGKHRNWMLISRRGGKRSDESGNWKKKVRVENKDTEHQVGYKRNQWNRERRS